MIYNALDYVALVVPTRSFVEPYLDTKRERHEFYGDIDKQNYESCGSCYYMMLWMTLTLTSDDPAIFKDAPIAVQIVGRTGEEEAVIRFGEIVDSALKTMNTR